MGGRIGFMVAVLLFSQAALLVRPTLAAQSAAQYCDQYSAFSIPSGSTYTLATVKNACFAGVNGTEDCNDYGLVADQSVIDICNKAAADRANDVVTPGPKPSTTPSPSASPSPSSSASPNPNQDALDQLQGLLDQTKSLSEYIDVLHENGPNKDDEPEDEADGYGYYINGAGKKQDLTVLKEGDGKSPVILFINGGGWHANDKSGQYVAGMDVPGGFYDNTGAEKAGDRGYAMIDLTYRLGSSSVYYAYEDVMRGIRSVRNNADLYKIDPDKMVIWGDSAGGSLSMRANASGKSGAKAAVGWSAPTNGYTAIFKSFQSFGVGVDHSTCAPTDLAGFANFADLAAGGSGDVAEYGQGLSSNDFSALGINLDGSSTGGMDPLALLTQGLIAGRNVLSAAGNMETISDQIGLKEAMDGGSLNTSGLAGSAMNIAGKKFVECLDNFNVLSPALFASPDSSPAYLAGFEDDGLVDPSQSYGMRDKLRQLGIKSDALILPGDNDCLRATAAPAGAGGCHLGYYKAFVCPTLNFVDSIVQPDRGETDCKTGVVANQASNEAAIAAGNGGDGEKSNGAQQSGPDCSQYISDGKQDLSAQKQACEAGKPIPSTAQTNCKNQGGTYTTSNGPHGGGYCKPASADKTSHYCLNQNDKLSQNSDGGWQCTYNSTFGGAPASCPSSSRTISAGLCAYGAGSVRQSDIDNAPKVNTNKGPVICYSCGSFTGKK